MFFINTKLRFQIDFQKLLGFDISKPQREPFTQILTDAFEWAQTSRRPQALLCQQRHHRDNLPPPPTFLHEYSCPRVKKSSLLSEKPTCTSLLSASVILLSPVPQKVVQTRQMFISWAWESNLNTEDGHMHTVGNSEHHMAGIKAALCSVSLGHLAPFYPGTPTRHCGARPVPFFVPSHPPAACPVSPAVNSVRWG